MIIACSFILGVLLYLLFILLYNLIVHVSKLSYSVDHDDISDYYNNLYYYGEIDYNNKIYKKDLKIIKIISIIVVVGVVLYILYI